MKNIYTFYKLEEPGKPDEIVAYSLSTDAVMPTVEVTPYTSLREAKKSLSEKYRYQYVDRVLFDYVVMRRQIAAGMLPAESLTDNIRAGIFPEDIEQQAENILSS